MALALFAAGLVFALGTLVDLGVLWFAQRQPSAQWEFVAISSTVEALPRFVLALALTYTALHLSESGSALAFRALGAGMLLIGLTGAALGSLMVTVYFPMAQMVQEQSVQLFRSSVIKAVALGGLHAVVLVPIGIIGLRGPKG